jgi:hypothetical protein
MMQRICYYSLKLAHEVQDTEHVLCEIIDHLAHEQEEKEAEEVRLELLLDMDLADIHPDHQQEFKNDMARDVAEAVGGDASKVRVLALEPIRVHTPQEPMQLSPSACTRAISMRVHTALDPGVLGDQDAVNVAQVLAQQASDPNSALKNRRLTSTLTAATVNMNMSMSMSIAKVPAVPRHILSSYPLSATLSADLRYQGKAASTQTEYDFKAEETVQAKQVLAAQNAALDHQVSGFKDDLQVLRAVKRTRGVTQSKSIRADELHPSDPTENGARDAADETHVQAVLSGKPPISVGNVCIHQPHTHVHKHKHKYTYIHTHIHTHTYTNTHSHTHTHTHTHTHFPLSKCTHTQSHTHTHTHTHTHAHSTDERVALEGTPFHACCSQGLR